jgi:PAS domain S-box-containing protein
MPVMDGFEATRQIKAAMGDHWVPVVFLSAMDKPEDLVRGMDSGGDDYMVKPINLAVLEAKLRSFVRMLDMQRRLEFSVKQLSAITENIVDGIIRINEAGNIIWASPAAANIFDYAQADMIGHNVKLLMPEPYHSEHDGYLEHYQTSGMPRIIGVGHREVQGRRQDGTIFPMELGVSEIRVDGIRTFVGIIRDISERKSFEERLKEKSSRLQQYYDAQEQENLLALDIMQKMVQHEGLTDPAIRYWMSPVGYFSGDIVAAHRNADGKLYAMLADATGHGLAAAISSLPVLSSFYGLAREGRNLADMIALLNQSLLEMLPTGFFLAATLLYMDQNKHTLQLWQGGMPVTLRVDRDGNITQEFKSDHLPLGIIELTEEMATPHTLEWRDGDQFLMFSDGIIEATDAGGQLFGMGGLTSAWNSAPIENKFDSILERLNSFMDGIAQLDDMSLLLVQQPENPDST